MARSAHSAGIIAYRRGELLEVFLVHPGGPYWMRRDAGAWSIPKGEFSSEELPLRAALREFHEETGLALAGTPWPLAPVRQRGGKWIHAWAVEAPALDPSRVRSNLFMLEWPPRSGQQREFPEVDRAAWFALPEALERLLAGQRPLLEELAAALAARASAGNP